MNRFLQMLFLALALCIITVLASSSDLGYAAYEIGRAVHSVDEPIKQDYLYGVGTAVHKGVDWSTPTLGDPVYSVSSGTVRQVKEDRANGCSPTDPDNLCATWGNYVLIEHDIRHYDRISGQMGYVYSLYLHLK